MRETEDKKIKIVMIANNLEINGISSVIMNYCSHLDLEKFEITILAGSTVADFHQKKCDELGIEVVELPHRKKETKEFYLALNRELKKQKYEIAHVHGSHAAIAVELFLAWKNGIRIRIAHSHNTTCTSMRTHRLMQPFFRRFYTQGFACGEKAGEWLFGKKEFLVVANGFETEKFRYDPAIRSRIRRELGVEGAYVAGHMGRVNDQKNQRYLLQIFAQLARTRQDAVLLLVGTGPAFEEIREMVSVHPFKERIILYGETQVPEQLYQAMDVFVFPSKYEGLPVTLLEAQISGLPCVISDVITREAVLGKQVQTLSIQEDPRVWADRIAGLMPGDRGVFDRGTEQKIKQYDIRACARKLEETYVYLETLLRV